VLRSEFPIAKWGHSDYAKSAYFVCIAMYRPNVSLIVFRKSDGKFLLVHKPRKNHAWQFPQGGVDEGETLEQAGLRELQEELGTDKFQGFEKSSHVFFYNFPVDYVRDDKYTGHKQSYFLVEFTGSDSDIQLDSKELDEFRWVYQNELPEYIESPEYLKKVNQVILEFRHLL
jgi:putative (di)nucleoside polyphosphate hydrolase